MQRKIAVIDSDGIVTDFDGCFRLWMGKRIGLNGSTPILPMLSKDYHLPIRYGIKNDFWDDLKVDDAFWANISLLPQAKELVYALEDLNYEAWMVTAIGENQKESRHDSLMGLIPKGRIICTGWNSTSADKARAVRELGAVAFLDDNWEHVMAVNPLPRMICARHYHHPDFDLGPVPDSIGVIDDVMDFPATLELMQRNAGF